MPRTEAPRWTLNERKRSTCFGAYEFALCGWASAPHNPAAARSREPGQVRREWIAESGFQSAWRVDGSEAVGRRMWSIGNGRPPSSTGERSTTTKPSAS